MGFLDGLFNPSKNTTKAYKRAGKRLQAVNAKTDPFYDEIIGTGLDSNRRLSDFLGLNGMATQQSAYDSYLTSPGFDFQFDRGQQALDQSAFSRGGMQSGAQLKDLQQFGQGLYAMDMDNYLNRLTGMAGQGFSGAQGLTNNALNLNNISIGKGQSRDAGNAAAAGNMIGLGTTLGSMAFGMPPMGSGQASQLSQLFAQPSQTMPMYANGRVNPYAPY